MYTDYQIASRDGWKFLYVGKDLAGPALAKYKDVYDRERQARQQVANLTADMHVSVSDDRLVAAKRDIEKYGTEREKLQVFVHEFRRNPEREYHLSIGDVAYLALAPEPEITLSFKP